MEMNAPPGSAFSRFVKVFFGSLVTFFAASGVVVWAFDEAGYLPPPPLTATNCIDEKFQFIRQHRDLAPDLLAVGSSVTWRNLDFSELEKSSVEFQQPLNGAPCYLTVNQTAWLTNFYLKHLPSVRSVITVFAMRDFEGCEIEGKLFDENLGRMVMFSDLPEFPVYVVNFRPIRLLEDVGRIRQMRSGEDRKASLRMDEFGSGPLTLTPPDPRDDVVVTAGCYRHLAEMQSSLETRGIPWLVVLMPPMPSWLKRYDPDGARDRAWRKGVAAVLRSSNTKLIDGIRSPFGEEHQFVDPAHFHWSWAGPFTKWIFRENRGRENAQSKAD
jgi:hypothetical protein